MVGIYKITSPSGRIYIGQSIDIETRWSLYRLMHCKNQVALYRSFVKHGVGNHIFEVLEECDISLLNERERYYQDLFNVLSFGLNCKLTTTKDKSGKSSEATKEKMRNSMMGKNKGIKRSRESVNKMIKTSTGKKRTNEFKLWLSDFRKGDKNPMFGKKVKESSKQLQRDKLSGDKNYLSKPIINLQTGVFYECLREAGDSIGMDKRMVHQNITRSKINKTPFIYA